MHGGRNRVQRREREDGWEREVEGVKSGGARETELHGGRQGTGRRESRGSNGEEGEEKSTDGSDRNITYNLQ